MPPPRMPLPFLSSPPHEAMKTPSSRITPSLATKRIQTSYGGDESETARSLDNLTSEALTQAEAPANPVSAAAGAVVRDCSQLRDKPGVAKVSGRRSAIVFLGGAL